MTAPDSGVDQLFRRVTEDLHPDTSRIVADAIHRGRARRRRHLAGAAVASAATLGAVAAGAAVVPWPGPDAAEQAHVATRGATATATPTQVPPTTSPLSESGRPTLPAAEIPQLVAELAPGHQVSRPLTNDPYPLVDSDTEKIVHFRVDGMLTSVIISRARASLAYDCGDERTVTCRTRADGTVLQVARPSTADQVTMRCALALGKTWMVVVMSYNAAEGKGVPPIRPEPALTVAELVTVASSDAWFE